MAFTVYGNPFSTCTRKVLTTLHERAQDFEFVAVDLSKGEHKQPAHLARQPFGVVPALDHDGFGLYESRAIMAYIDDVATGGASLTPREPQQRALMRQWQSVEQSYFGPAAMKIVMEEMFAPMFGRQGNAERAAEGRNDLTRVADILERTLSKQSYFVGEQFTHADIGHMPYVEYVLNTSGKEIITSRPGLSAWWQRVSNRPSWKKVVGR